MAKVESKRKSLVKVLAAGSSGLIGTALCSRLEREGHEVVRLVRRQPTQGELRWDPEAGELEQEALEGIEAAVHLGGRNIAAGRWTAAVKAQIAPEPSADDAATRYALGGIGRAAEGAGLRVGHWHLR